MIYGHEVNTPGDPLMVWIVAKKNTVAGWSVTTKEVAVETAQRYLREHPNCTFARIREHGVPILRVTVDTVTPY